MFKSATSRIVSLASAIAVLSSFAQAGVTLDLEDKTVDLTLVSLPHTFTYSIIATTTSPDTGKLVNAFDTRVNFSPLPSGIELLGVSSSLPGYSSGVVNPPVPATLGSQVINIPAFSSAPSLPAGPFNILTYTLRVNTMPVSNVSYATAITGLTFTESVLNTPIISATLQTGSLTLISSAIPEPLTAAGVLLLSTRVLGRRSRLSM